MRLLIFLMLFTQSCQVYRSNFDCAPGEGIPCRSVTEIESMIVESCEGPDILVEKESDSVVLVRRKSHRRRRNCEDRYIYFRRSHN